MSATTAVVGLLSALLGASLGGVLSYVADRRRWEREDRQRWHDQRLQAYATTLDRLTRVFRVLQVSEEVARARFQPPWGPTRVRRQLQKAERPLEDAQEALFATQLVGGAECVAATERCLQVIRKLADELPQRPRASRMDLFNNYLRELSAAREELVHAARRELNVSRGE